MYTTEKAILLVTILVSILSSCNKDNKKNPEKCYSNINAKTIVHDGLNREYVLYIPNSLHTSILLYCVYTQIAVYIKH